MSDKAIMPQQRHTYHRGEQCPCIKSGVRCDLPCSACPCMSWTEHPSVGAAVKALQEALAVEFALDGWSGKDASRLGRVLGFVEIALDLLTEPGCKHPKDLDRSICKTVDRDRCPRCGDESASPPAEVYCVECATTDWDSQPLSDQDERAAMKAALTALIDEACEIHENPHPLIGFRDYLLHRLGTYGYAHDEHTLRQAIEQHDGLVAENEALKAERDEMRRANVTPEDAERPYGQSVQYWQDRCLDHATALDNARIENQQLKAPHNPLTCPECHADGTMAEVQALLDEIERLREALMWVETRYRQTLAGESVRDADECLEHSRLLLARPFDEQDARDQGVPTHADYAEMRRLDEQGASDV